MAHTACERGRGVSVLLRQECACESVSYDSIQQDAQESQAVRAYVGCATLPLAHADTVRCCRCAAGRARS